MFGSQCCTFIPNNMAPSGTFTDAMKKIKDLRREVHANAGRDKQAWDWFDLKFGHLGGLMAKTGLINLACLLLVMLMGCCVMPLIRSFITTTVSIQLIMRAYGCVRQSEADPMLPLIKSEVDR